MNLALILLKTEPAHPLFDAVRYVFDIDVVVSKKAFVDKPKNIIYLRSKMGTE
jgi:hypothetical protein